MGIVVLCHAGVPNTAGGFVGVDVFFVISGFLITQWLVGKTVKANGVPFASFYATRARRILPAAALTLVATCIAGWYALNYVRALSAMHDAIWGTFFAANIHFASAGADYFARESPPSPFQQFWTLAVEEQFYLAWPALLAACLALLRWRRYGLDGAIRVRLGALVALGVGASFAWSVHVSASDPQSAYFSTPARAWELGVGVLLALGLPAIARIGTRLRAALAWAGLAGIGAATVLYGGGTPFPGAAALLPVVATALVIAGGVAPAPAFGAGALLRHQPFQVVGDVSYSFYLWHWPALVLAAAYAGHGLSMPQSLAVLAAAFLLSYVTYRIYEDPLRHARRLGTPGAALCLWPASVMAVVAAAMLVVWSLPVPAAAVARIDVPGTGSGHGPAGPPAPPRPPTSRQVEAAVAASVSRRSLREPIPTALAPSIGALAKDGYDMRGCDANLGATSSKICRWGDARARRTVVVFGDSHAQMWMPALVRFAALKHWRLVPLVAFGCVPATMGTARCSAWYDWALGEVRRMRPRAVIVAQFWSSWGAGGVSAVERELDGLAPLTRRLMVIQDAPVHPVAAVDCLLARGATRGSCTFPVTPAQAATFAAVRSEAAAAGARYVRTVQWLCARGRCPTVVGNVIVYRDKHHLTATYVRFLARPLARRIELGLR